MNVFFSVLSAVAAIASLLGAFLAVRYARRVAELPRAKLRSIELRTESLENSVSEWSQTVTDLANSQKMTRVRAASTHASKARTDDGLPDPFTDPDGWRKAMNKRIAMSKFNGG
jgi:ABC-type transport system involved in cytochrome bd biosynthesis fused ATPase/permease subunit